MHTRGHTCGVFRGRTWRVWSVQHTSIICGGVFAPLNKAGEMDTLASRPRGSIGDIEDETTDTAHPIWKPWGVKRVFGAEVGGQVWTLAAWGVWYANKAFDPTP